MKASLKWLSQYLDLSAFTPEEIASKLTFAGLEVDSFASLASGSNLVIGKIISCKEHPDSDHLHVLEVDEGEKYGVHQIVCGAPNAREGLKVIVAREGAILPNVTIAKSQIRGVDSDGMCCSLLELGVERKYLSDKQISGIEELPLDASVGEENVLKYLGLDDTVYEIELLANRGDLLSVLSLAYELSAILDIPVKKEAFAPLSESAGAYKVNSKTVKCPIFHGAVAKGVQIKESPKWLKEALLSLGVRSINNIVDIGNYVMLLTGEPVNMYDLSSLKGHELTAIDDYEGDFLSLDEKHYEIKKGDVLIASEGVPLCLAGIMTSKEASVSDKTKDVFIECALFDGAAIRRTSNRLGLSSDSSTRFVKGVSPEIQEEALAAIIDLIEKEASPSSIEVLAPYDEYPHQEIAIEASSSYINKRLGTSFDTETIVKTLRRDHIEIKALEGENFLAYPPKRRMDIKGKEDLTEEIIRLLGYEKVIARLPALSLSSSSGLSEEQKAIRSIRSFLRDSSLNETLTYSLQNAKQIASFEGIGKYEHYAIKNPLTEEHKYLRTSLLPSLLEVASYNLSRQTKDFGLFEISDVDALSYQGKRLAILLAGDSLEQGELHKRPFSFYDLKGYLEGILSLLKLSPNRFKRDTLTGQEYHPYRSERLLLGKNPVAVYGEAHPSYKEKMGFPKTPLLIMEIDLGALLSLKSSPDKAILPPRYPAVSRDIAFLCDKKESYESIRGALLRLDKRIEKVSVFDLYEGEGIASDKKSMALHLTLRKEEGTLEEKEAIEVMEKVTNALKALFLAEIRG